MNALSNHELLWPFIKTYNLQASFETDNINNSRKKKYDMEFSGLQFVIEIDENHTNAKVLTNDAFKNILASMNGNILIRMNFQEIYKNEGALKGIGEIKDGLDANDYIIDSTYYGEFLELMYDCLINSLLNNNNNFRKSYILHLFNQSLQKQISTIKASIKRNNKKLTQFNKIIKTSKSESKKVVYKEASSRLEKIQSINNKSVDDLKDVIEFIKTDQNFLKLFSIKDKYKPKFIGDRNIPFNEVLDLVDMVDMESISNLLTFMYEIRIISQYYESHTDIRISWKELSEIIIKFESTLTLSKVLILYYLELEESYESIINRMLTHTKQLIPDDEKYNICMNNENRKAIKPFKKEIQTLKSDKSKLEKQIGKLTSNFKKLCSKFKFINLSYNKLFDGEYSHRRSTVNIQFNKNRLINIDGVLSDESESDDDFDSDYVDN
ncbi:MAG: hypothetical protein ACRCZI_02850 [Cetobacterium sp.]